MGYVEPSSLPTVIEMLVSCVCQHWELKGVEKGSFWWGSPLLLEQGDSQADAMQITSWPHQKRKYLISHTDKLISAQTK